jgi:iron(III) transport system ATP-binding protein
MTSPDNTALIIDRISVSYQHRQVLDKLSLTVSQNEILCLLGQSGSGKTTVLKSIAGLIQVNAGQISLAGETLSSQQKTLLPEQRGVGIIFQDFALFPHLTVFENVCFGIQRLKKNKQQIGDDLLELVKMTEFAQSYPNELSGGQQQRVAIARALGSDPKILLLDEPFSNVDHHLREQLMFDIRDVLKRQTIPAIFVTHSREEAFTFADRLSFMEAGKIVQEGTAESLYFQPTTPSLAESMGEGNWLDVTMIDSVTTHSIHLGRISSTVAHSRSVLSEACQFIRPNQIKISADPHASAQIVNQVFNGEMKIYFIALDDKIFRVNDSGEQTWEIGTKVSLTALSHQAILFDKA